MSSPCKLQLLKNAPHIVGEDTVEGFFTLETTEEAKVSDVRVMFNGFIRCEYMFDAEYPTDDDCLVVPSGKYGSSHIIVNDTKIVHDNEVLPVGTYKFQFAFPLLERYLTSFESEHGFIRYEMSLHILNLNSPATIFKFPISVIKKFNLNSNPYLREPQQFTLDTKRFINEKDYSVSYTLTIPAGAYVPGQTIEFTLEVKTKDKQKNVYQLRLIKIVEYNFTIPHSFSKREEKVLCSVDVPQHNVKEQTIKHKFIIPSTPPTIHSELISVEYVLRVAVDNKLASSRLKGQLPIVIGTIPFSVSTEQIILMETDEEKDVNIEDVEDMIIHTYSTAFSPRVEADHNEDLEETEGVVVFKPLYSYYKQK